MNMVDDTSFEQEIHDFFKGAQQGLAIWRQASAILDLHIARRFNFFHSIKFNENRMSDVLAFLLRPDQAHGQGELFLREFLVDVKGQSDTNMAWWPTSDCSYVRVEREVGTNEERKIDIVIAFDGDQMAIAIENKPWVGSTDLERQLNDYANYLRSVYGECFKLIYLTPNGEDPSRNSIDPTEREELARRGQFANAAIRKWAGDNGWLKRAEDEIKAERVRWFVSDFRKALIENLPAEE